MGTTLTPTPMRITPDLDVAGYPAIRVRGLFRRVFRDDRWSHHDVASHLGISRREAVSLIADLEMLGYLERVANPHPFLALHRMTRKGAALRIASAAKPIRRETADRLVNGLVVRAQMLAGDAHPYAYRLVELVIFGSYLTDATHLGDVDVAYDVGPRFPDSDEQHAYKLARIQAAIDAGRSFQNSSVEYGWPEDEFHRHLRGGHRAISLMRLLDNPEQRAFLESIPHRRLYPGPTD